MKVEILSPYGAAAVEAADFLDVPASDGRLTVLDRHEPFVCTLVPGVVRLRAPDGAREWQVGAGTMAVRPELVSVLVGEAVPLPAKLPEGPG
jgi:F-type H+-transporting ATPase subunit epsilon